MQLKLRASIVLAVIVGLLIPVIINASHTLHQREQYLTQQLAQDHRRLTEILALGMAEPLWNLNHNAGLPLFESMLGDTRIVALTVRESRFGVFLEQRRPERRSGRLLKLDRDVLHNNQVIGRVSVEMDGGQLDAEIARDRRMFMWTTLGQLLLSLLLIVALLQVRLLAPIRRLMLESQKLARRQLDEPFEWHRNDELGSLGRSLESTRQALRTLFNEIESKNRALEQDIERRVRTEKELQRHREHLEELVRERTAELTVAKERAEVANKAKSAFLASMSHELRTPLNAVLGYTQALKRDTNLTERQLSSLNTIQQSGEHLLTLITDLLDLSKIEAGRLDLFYSMVDLPAFLQVIADIIRVRAEQKGLLFTCELAPDLPHTVLIDEKRLRQVLLNLLGNAVRFTDRGQVGLRVRRMSGDAPQARVCFEIHDTGVGIRQDQFESIFHPFEQVGDAHRRLGGTGLGLSISRELARLMNSDIHVESRPGKGSVFRFELSVATAEMKIAPRAPERGIIGYQGEPKTALIVDDIAASRAMLSDMLLSLGFGIGEASCGSDSMKQAQSLRPDVILTSSLEAMRRLRRIKEMQATPVIAILANTAAQDAADVTNGPLAVMTRPIDKALLLQHIGNALGLTWIIAEQPEAVAPPQGANSLAIPPQEEMDVLYRLALAGNMRAIREYAAHLERLDKRYRPFADRLRQMSGKYQSRALVELVEKYVERKQES